MVVIGVAGAVIFGIAAPAAADVPYPAPNGRCIDTAGVLGTDVCDRVTAMLMADETASSDEVAVAVVPTTESTSIETWATGLFNSWGVGKKGQDNGVLLVVAIKDHRMRIATGRGMGERLSDSRAAGIISSTITPDFKAGRYAAGILAGLDEIRRAIGRPVTQNNALAALAVYAPEVTVSDDAEAAPGSGAGRPFPIWLVVCPAVVAVGLALRLASRRVGRAMGLVRTDRPWYGSGAGYGAGAGYGSNYDSGGGGASSGFGGGGGSFGGGGSDGGGASGSW
jgi:uncharacterized protein